MKRSHRLLYAVPCVICFFFLSILGATPGISAPPPFPPHPPGVPFPKPPQGARRPMPPPPGPRMRVPPPGPRMHVPPPGPRVFVPPPGVPFPRPPRRVIVRSLPADILSLHIAGALFFYHLGEYYQRTNEGYVVVEAPIGARVNVLPSGCSSLRMGGSLFFNCEGVYYEPIDNGFIVVEPPPSVREINPEATTGDWVSIQADVLNVRSGPGRQFETVNQLYQGQTVKVYSVDRGWYYVHLPDDSYGWIMSQYTEIQGRRYKSNDGSKG